MGVRERGTLRGGVDDYGQETLRVEETGFVSEVWVLGGTVLWAWDWSQGATAGGECWSPGGSARNDEAGGRGWK